MIEENYEGYPPFLKQYFEDYDILIEFNKRVEEDNNDER